MSKESRIIEIMNEHASEPMGVVVILIAKEFDFKDSRARAYYSGMVKAGRAPGRVEPKVVRTAPKRVRVPAAKRMTDDLEAVLAGKKPGSTKQAKTTLYPGLIPHEEVLARLLARKPVADDGDEEDIVPEVKPIGEPDEDYPLSISEGELAEVLGR